MRIVYPILAFVASLVLLGFGMSQLTAGTDETQTVETQPVEEAPYTVITRGVVDPDSQRDQFTINAEGEYSVALGRLDDIRAWIGEAPYTEINGYEQGQTVEGGPVFTATHVSGEGETPNPADSDLWVATETTEGDLLYRWNTPDDVSDWALLVFRDGEAPAPATISTEVPIESSNTAGVVMLIGSAVLLILALILFYGALGARRRRRAQSSEEASADTDTFTLTGAALSAATTVPAAAAAERDSAAASSSETSSVPADSVETHSASTMRPHAHHPDPSEHPTETINAMSQPTLETDSVESTESPRDATRPDDAATATPADDADTEMIPAVEQDDTPTDTVNPVPDHENSSESESQPDELTAEQRRIKNKLRRFSGGSATAFLAISALSASALFTSADTAQATESSQSPNTEDQENASADDYSMLLSSQLQSIVDDIAETVAQADEAGDADQLSPRVAGNALEARTLAYRNQELVDAPAPDPIGTEILSAAVTGESEFPRQAFVITEGANGEVPQLLILEQESARSNYQLVHTASMAPGAQFSSVSAEEGGVRTVPVGEDAGEDDNAVSADPHALITDLSRYFADETVDFGDEISESQYITQLHEYQDELGETVEDADVTFPEPEVDSDTYALEMPDGSMIVAGSFDVVTRLSPLNDGDTIFVDNELVTELAGTEWTTFPMSITSRESVVLQVPAEDSDAAMSLLGIDTLTADANIDAPDWFQG